MFQAGSLWDGVRMDAGWKRAVSSLAHSDRFLSSSDTCSPDIRRRLFLSAEASNATPGVCVRAPVSLWSSAAI